MTELLTSAQMRAVEKAAIDSGTVTGLTLMERAGQGVVDAILAQWPAFAEGAHRAIVLCGPGNNGGDGFVVARLLREAGWEVAVYLYGDAQTLPPDAKVNHARWAASDPVQTVQALAKRGCKGDPNGPPPLFVDACFGIGLTRPIGPPLAGIVAACNNTAHGHVVSIDLPSGLDSDTGRALGTAGTAFIADLTVTFHRLKPAHVAADGARHCGKVVVADIGL